MNENASAKGNGKRLVKVIIYALIICGIVSAGIGTGLFDSVQQAFAGLHLDAAAIVRVIVMFFLVLLVQDVLIMLIGLIRTDHHRTNTVLTIIASIIRYAGAIIIICWGLRILGVDVATIVAGVGIIALIVGFGAESLIADMITGLFTLFEDQYNVGDIVEVDGYRGTVTNIGIRTTAITDAGGNIKIINNSNMKNILNRSNIASRAIAEIGIPYEADLEWLESQLPDVLQAAYEAHTDKFTSVPEYLGVSALGDSAVMLKFLVEVSEADIFSGQRALTRELYLRFKKLGVEVPYTQIDLHQK